MYSIKTDLGVSGSSTVDKNLLVNGNSIFKGDVQIDGDVDFSNATFTQLTVSNTANLADIVSTGTASISELSVSGNTTLGNSNSETLTVNGTSTFVSPIILQSNVTQQSGTASFKATTLESLSVSGVSTLNGDLSMGAGTTATVVNLESDTISTTGNVNIDGELEVSGKTVLGDLEINGTLSGSYTIDSGNFTNLKVTQLSELNNVNISGSVVLLGNVTGTNSTISLNHVRMLGSDAIIDFAYNDPSRPTDIKSSIEPYQISTNDIVSKLLKSNSADIGVVGGTSGLHAIGRATIDYLNITGNSTIGDQDQLVVSGKTVLTGKTTVGDLEITGLVSGITVDVTGQDITPKSVIAAEAIKGNTLESVTTAVIGTNLTVGGNAEVNGNIIANGDVSVSNNTITVKDLVVTGTTTGVTVAADVDGLDIKPNSVDVDTTLNVTGPSTLSSVIVTGTVTGTTPSTPINVSGVIATGNINASAGQFFGTGTALAVSSNANIGGNLNVDGNTTLGNGSTDTVTVTGNTTMNGNLSVTGTFTPAAIDLSSTDINALSLTTTGDVTVGGDLTISGGFDLSTADVMVKSITATDPSTIPSLSSTAATLTTANVTTLNVSGVTTLAGTTTGALTATSISTPTIANGANNVTFGSNVIMSDDLTVQGALILSGTLDLSSVDIDANSIHTTGNATIDGNITSNNSVVAISKNTIVGGDLSISGTLTAGTLDLSTTDVDVQSLNSSGNVTVGGDLTVSGQFDLSSTNLQAASVESTGTTTVGTNLILTTGNITGSPVISGTMNVNGATTLTTLGTSGLATLNSAQITTTLGVTGITTLGVANTGILTSTTVNSTGLATLNSLEVTNNATVKGNLTIEGTLLPEGGFDLSSTDITSNSLTTTNGVTVGGNLTTTGTSALGVVTASTVTGTGVGKFGSVTADNGLTITSGNISQTGAATATATFKKTNATVLHVGTLAWDEAKYISEFGGNTHISGDLDVDGTINASINLTGRDIAPRSITTSQFIKVGSTLEVVDTATMESAVIGSTGSVNNNLQINGNTVCTGNFTVQGFIIGTLDQTTSDVQVKSLTSNTSVTTETLSVTSTSSFGDKLTVQTGGIDVTGDIYVDGDIISTELANLTRLTTTGVSTLGAKVTISAGGLAVTGGTTTDTITVSGASTLNNITVTGTSGFTGAMSAVNITSTGLITAHNLTITGTLTTDIANLVTASVTTKKYQVQAAASQSVASGSTWTPDGTTNAYNVTLTGAAGAVSFGTMPFTVGMAASWFIYVTQDSVGGKTINWGTDQKLVGTSAINETANSVSICQLVYCGYGNILDVFIAQRNT